MCEIDGARERCVVCFDEDFPLFSVALRERITKERYHIRRSSVCVSVYFLFYFLSYFGIIFFSFITYLFCYVVRMCVLGVYSESRSSQRTRMKTKRVGRVIGQREREDMFVIMMSKRHKRTPPAPHLTSE